MADIFEGKLDARLERFLDADTIASKIAIAGEFVQDVTDFDVDTMASAMDIAIPEGKPYERLMQLLRALKVKQKYEVTR